MLKNIIIGAGIAVTSYKIGVAVGSFASLKSIVDVTEKAFPGIKKEIANKTASEIMEHIFKTRNTEEKVC